jgi:hypothetical protein
VYASLLKSQALLSSEASESKGQDTAAGNEVRNELERQLGSQASAISRNLEPTLNEALELKR